MANFHDTSAGNTRNSLVGIDIFNISDNLEKKRKMFSIYIFIINSFRGKILKIIFLREIDLKIKFKFCFFFKYGIIHILEQFLSYEDMSFVAHFVIIKNLERTSEEKTLND